MIVVCHCSDPPFQNDDVEIDQQAEVHIKQSQMRKPLDLVDWMECFFTFQFDDHSVSHDQVCSEPTIQLYRFLH